MDHITVPKVENVKLLDHYVGKKPANGSLYLTATHLIYVETSGAARKETWIALHHIATVEKSSITSLGCPLILRCKNFRVAHFVLESDVVCHEVYIPLLKLSQPELHEDLYAFSYNPKSSKEMRENGLKLIDPISDFGRLGLPNRYWTITDANRNYELNAMANRAAGKGYENEGNYANIRFRFIGIENIHVMWSSLQKLLEACAASRRTRQLVAGLHGG
ncbi:myotubularin-related protein 8 isoform X3 [Pseudorca crassidens]|uniref:myotubularin-related protein 8 isoform X3 n=1 Tax=Pseudorca crassidens TaxID=82174 RepID=UPI00352E1C24